MRELLILRHAKSSWSDPEQEDHDRPLNKRGRLAAEALGQWIRARDLVPDEILCSSARRTCETVERMGLPLPPPRRDLYLADADTLLECAQEMRGTRILIVGHNPGIAAFARGLLESPPTHPRFFDYPTGALTVLKCAYAELPWGQGKICDFIVPADFSNSSTS